jgi:DNA-binding Lrp family transcriptional regulator
MKAFSPRLDKISESMIYLLSLDSRITISELSKELNVNRKIVENRFNNLFNKKYIKPLAVTNENNRFRFTILAKLSTFDPKTFEKIRKTKGLLKLKETLGAYDISMLFDVYSQKNKEEIIEKISNLLSESTISFDVVHHSFEDTLGYKSFCHDPKYFSNYIPLSNNSLNTNGDELKVIGVIKENPLESFVELSRKTKLGYPKIKLILNKLQEHKAIRFSVDPDYEKLGLQFHNILLKIKPGKKVQFDQYIRKHPRIHWVKESLGRWNYILSIATRDINELIDVSKQIRTENQDTVLEETVLISKVKEARKY